MDIFKFIPGIYYKGDDKENSRKYLEIFQEFVNKIEENLDRYLSYVDVRNCPSEWLRFKLFDRGWDLKLDLTDTQKRKLIPLVTSIYRYKGTTKGIINTILALLGITVTVRVIQESSENLTWVFGRPEDGTSDESLYGVDGSEFGVELYSD